MLVLKLYLSIDPRDSSQSSSNHSPRSIHLSFSRSCFKMARMLAISLVLLAIGSQVNAQYGGTGARDSVASKGQYNSARDKYFLSSFSLAEMKGVWQVDGLEVPQAQATAQEESAVPDCANNGELPSYVGLDYDAPRFTALVGAANATNLMNVNQQRSTFSPNVTFTYPFLVATNANTGAKTCTHWQPYVDIATGELLAESLAITVWSTNTTAGATRPIQSRPVCELTGREQVGCYTGAVTLGPAMNMAPTAAPTVAISSIPGIAPASARPEGSVVTISKTQFRCRQGECLRLSPKHSSTSPVYGG